MRIRATLAILASAALGALALGAPPAAASSSTTAAEGRTCWKLKINDHDDKGEACYYDKREGKQNQAKVDDQEGNSRSVVLVISKKGGGDKSKRCWDHLGADGPGNTCTVRKWEENVNVRGRLCPAEWAKDKENRDIKWKHCTKYKSFEI